MFTPAHAKTSARATPLRLPLLGALLAGLILSLFAHGTPDASAADAPRATASKERCAYPPARLWYRLQLDFKGRMSGDAGGLEHSRESSWSLRSNTAVRVTLLCVNRKFPDKPFFNTPKLGRKDGKFVKQRIGGCEKRCPNLMATARFRAGAGGEVTSWKHLEITHPPSCELRRSTQTLLAPQELGGSLFSASSATDGLHFRSDPAGVGGFGSPISIFSGAIACAGPNGPFTAPANTGTRGFTLTDHIGWESVIDSQQVAERMRFEFPPGKFSKRLRLRFGPFD